MKILIISLIILQFFNLDFIKVDPNTNKFIDSKGR